MNLTAEDRDLVIRTLIGEAGREPIEGQAAVVGVIRNRMNEGRYGGRSAADVVLAPKQFEPWQTRRSELLSYSPDSPAYKRAASIVDGVFSGQIPDYSGGATHFLNPDIVMQRRGGSLPSWANGETARIGGHAFYKPAGGGGRAGGAQVAAIDPSAIQWDDEPAPAQPMAFAATGPTTPRGPSMPPKEVDPAAIKWDDAPAPSPFGGLSEPQVNRATPDMQAQLRAASGVPTRTESFVRGVGQGATFNMQDEMAGAGAASPLPGSAAASKTTFGAIGAPDVLMGAGRMMLEKLAPSIFGNGGTQAAEQRTAQARQENTTAREANPWTYTGGQIAGGLAMPAAAPVTGVRSGAATGAAFGGLYGFGEGEGLADSTQRAALGAGVGGAAGGALGGVVGRFARPPVQTGPTSNEVIDAAERLSVDVPRAVATDSRLVQRAGESVKAVPGAEASIGNATTRLQEQITEEANRVAGQLGTGSADVAGEGARSAISGWITGKSAAAVKRAYDMVDNAITNPNVTTPLAATQRQVADILAERQASRISDPGKAVSFVADAVQDAKGLTYEGVKGLRTRIGEMLKNPSVLPADVSKAELKRIYGSLTDDLRAAVENAGGPVAVKTWEAANDLASQVAKRRQDLAKIIGKSGDAPAEQVFNKLAAMASSGSRADIGLLTKARKAMPPADWQEVASGIVANLGRDAQKNWTPDRFVTAWGKLSDNGKQLLFDPATRRALDDISTISTRIKDIGNRFGNPSGSGNRVGWLAAGGGLLADPLTTIGTVVGGNVLARMLAKPATASSMAKWARAYEATIKAPSAGAVATLQSATRNLSATAGEKIPFDGVLRLMQGAASGRANDGSENPEGVTE